jgi:hypothetical protein
MTSRFWWKLQEWWHWPGFIRRAGRPTTFIHLYPSELGGGWFIDPMIGYYWNNKKYKRLVKTLWRDTINLVIIIYRELIWLQPFRCNNGGGWRTNLCVWLENKAIEQEEKEGL